MFCKQNCGMKFSRVAPLVLQLRLLPRQGLARRKKNAAASTPRLTLGCEPKMVETGHTSFTVHIYIYMRIYIHICICISTVYIYIYIYTYTHYVHIYISIYIYIHARIDMCPQTR